MQRVIIIGGGIVGLASARAIAGIPGVKEVVVLEKEDDVAVHQTGRNSGVIHSGIYYKPGSLKAVNCREGRQELIEFCGNEGIAIDLCGKVIVATDPAEFDRLAILEERGKANGVECEMIGPERLAEIEPAVSGLRALHVRDAGIVDYVAVSRRLRAQIEERGGRVVCGARVRGMRVTEGRVVVESEAGAFQGNRAVNCAGLYSDKVTAMTCRPEMAILPFRGEYFTLKPMATGLCRNLVYPVPDPAFPFLGVHFTRMIGGGVECGPNAVLAFAREGYRKTDIDVRELMEVLVNPDFLRLAAKYWRMGAGEFHRSWSKTAFVRALQRLIPEVRTEHLEEAPAGIRAQAIARGGGLVDDFFIQRSGPVVHVCNAPSPAATASLRIGRHVADLVASN